MAPDLPFWFKQRQAKAEEIGQATYQITGPNLLPGVVAARIAENLRWQGVLRESPDSSEVAATDPVFASPREALAAAFELYRNHMITG